jgi:UDP-N-acetylmuramyl tripeptide synthase
MSSTIARRPARTSAAVAVGKLANQASRLLRRGTGAVIGGRVALKLDPQALRRLTAGRPVTVVTGTNGKTTTTRLVAEALGSQRRVATTRGANMPAGLVDPASERADELVFEVDELWVPQVVEDTRASVLVMLNISRDQLDRITEIRRIAEIWRALLARVDWPLTVVANADDPLVVWAVGDHKPVVWVGGGYRWREDAALCPQCGRVRPIAADGDFRCECGLTRPVAQWCVEGDAIVDPEGYPRALSLRLPGAFNRANAATALAVARVRGVDLVDASRAVEAVESVAGRFVVKDVGGRRVRLLMGKNPASWSELVALLDGGTAPVIVCLNARGADGMDTSWIWDVPFEHLAGRTVVASGDRRLDLSVRLTVGGVEHTTTADPLSAVGTLPAGPVEMVATYTAFHDLLKALDVRW